MPKIYYLYGGKTPQGFSHKNGSSALFKTNTKKSGDFHKPPHFTINLNFITMNNK